MSVTTGRNIGIDLLPFRQRIAALCAWQMAAFGGCIGAGFAIVAIICDRFDLFDIRPIDLFGIVVVGLIFGTAAGLSKKHSDVQIARSIDRRSLLDDRLTTLFEHGLVFDNNSPFLSAVTADASPRLQELQPNKLFPFRVQRVHLLLIGLTLIGALLYVILDTTLLLPIAARLDATQMKQQAIQVQQVARPFLIQADKPEASAEDKQLAQGLRRFVHELSKGRISKQEALIRANQLTEQAQALEQKRTNALGESLEKAQSAGAKLQEMAQQGAMEKTDAAKQADQANLLQKQIAAMQNQLNASKSGQSSMSKSEQSKLASKLEAAQKQLQQIQISQAAADMLAKLQSMPEYQEAMKLLSKLQQQNQAQAQGQSAMTPEQMKEIADRLDQLAKQLDTDAKMKAYARALLEAAKQARACNKPGLAAAIAGACQLGGSSQGGSSLQAMGGRGGISKDIWAGNHGSLNKTDKSTLLNLKFEDRVITSQKGSKGAETYTEMLGPAHVDAKSTVPYQAMLPKYEKTAESAMAKGDVPPEMRAKVRDYFDSLHQGE